MVIEFQSNNVSCSDCRKWDGERCTKRGWTNENPDHPCMMLSHYGQQPDAEDEREVEEAIVWRLQPADSMREEARRLKREGLTYLVMARVSGVGYSTVRKVAEKRLGKVTTATMEKWAAAMPYMERMAGING